MKFEFGDISGIFTNTFQPEPYIINAYKDTHHAALAFGTNPIQSRPMKGRSFFAILHLWRKGDPQPLQQAKKGGCQSAATFSCFDELLTANKFPLRAAYKRWVKKTLVARLV